MGNFQSTYDQKVKVYLLGIIEIDGLVDGLDLTHHFLLVLFFDQRACPASAFAQISSQGIVEVDKADDCGRDARLLQILADVCGNCAHST